ncbi:TRAFAC clade GTPase domain-containing protein [Bradyrhizobium sp. B120]|uniref:TRAFAC clade GTPase domain-containing protein n=1 Tax=Bradyrhizobium sp. B120 TaxID=3410088 RepID=UPI003B98433A
MSAVELTCSNPDCRVAVDRKCVEGLPFDSCQFYGKPPTISAPISAEAQEAEPPKAGVDLETGTTLNAVKAGPLLRLTPSRVIAIIGTHDCGKTSLLAGMYDSFQEGVVKGISFAGSSTLHGFEEICHDSRVASKRGIAHSQRTKRGEVAFYHLDLNVPGEEGPVALLLADRSGEEYEEVADEISNAGPMFELRRADTVTLLVDGVRLSDPMTRHDVMGAISPIVRGLQEARTFGRRPQMAIVLTKNDAVHGSGRAAGTAADFERLVSSLKQKFEDDFSEIRHFVTTASPKNMTVKRGDGLGELLDFWLQPSRPEPFSQRIVSDDRVFSKLVPREE